MKEAVAIEWVNIIREELMKRGSVTIPSLGTLKVDHQNQERRTLEDGSVVMIPPKDRLKFIPET